MSNVVVRNINGVKGFCIYKGGVPYTYIKTRDAIELLGLVELKKDNTKKLMIRRFGQHYKNAIENDPRLKVMNPSEYGIDIIPNYSISLDRSIDENIGATSCTSDTCVAGQISGDTCVAREISNTNLIKTISEYDDILPEYTLDRVVFAIANKLRSSKAEEFRSALIWEVLPHFQMTATQDQINQIPILNQMTQFVYDNTNFVSITKQAVAFSKNILNMHLDRLGRLIGESDLTKLFIDTSKEYNNILESNNEYTVVDCITKYINSMKRHIGREDNKLTLEDIQGAIICDEVMFCGYISFLVHLIRDEEFVKIRDLNGYKTILVKEDVEEPWVRKAVPKNPEMKEVVKFLNMKEIGDYTQEDIVGEVDL